MLDIVHGYARRWHYQLNSSKSLAMDIGESSASRKRGRENQIWNLGESTVSEVDEQHHLGILRSVHISTTNRTNKRAIGVHSLPLTQLDSVWLSAPPHGS